MGGVISVLRIFSKRRSCRLFRHHGEFREEQTNWKGDFDEDQRLQDQEEAPRSRPGPHCLLDCHLLGWASKGRIRQRLAWMRPVPVHSLRPSLRRQSISVGALEIKSAQTKDESITGHPLHRGGV